MLNSNICCRAALALAVALSGPAVVLRAQEPATPTPVNVPAPDEKTPASVVAPATAPATKPATTRPDEPVIDGGQQVAIRLANLSRETVRLKPLFPPHFNEAAALLMAAQKLDPNEPSYPRALYEAYLAPQVRDLDAARAALATYRKLVPQDQAAMVTYIDMTLRLKETADERRKYLNDILDAPSVPSEVRSHAALRASQLAREQSDQDLEDAMLAQALRLNPLNLDALRARLERQSQSGTPVERFGTLLQMLKSNPAQQAVMFQIAQELSEAGLVLEALQFYPQTVKVANLNGVPLGRDFALAYATTLYMGGVIGQTQYFTVARAIPDQLLKQDSGDVEVLLVQWLIQRALGDAEKPNADKTKVQVLNAALNRLLTVRQQLGVVGPGSTTRPVESPDPINLPPDLDADVKKLQSDPQFGEVRLTYAQALADLIWYQVYIDNKPDEAAKHLPELKALLGDKHPVVVRIEGFIFLAQNQPDQAKVKFQAVMDQDVLARMGMILIDWASAGDAAAPKDKAMAEARQLLSEHPSGMLAVLLADGLRKLNVKLVERGDAAAIRGQLNAFPKDWLGVIDSPQAFYKLTAEMVDGRVLFPFGEPMYAKVTILNPVTSQYNLTIGAEGVIHPDLWFDAGLRGLVQQQVVGAAYERIAGPLVLKPGQFVTQRVRLDQGSLLAELVSRPQPSITFFASVRTNPRGEGGCGPCGYGVPFNSITERGSFALTDPTLRGLLSDVANGSPAVRMRGLELMGVLAESIRQNSPGNPKLMQLAGALLDAIDRSRQDPIQGVATWATFLTAVHAPAKRQVAMDSLLKDQIPERRLLGLLIANSLTPAQRKDLTTALLKEEKEPMVRTYAEAMRELAELEATIAATRPAATTQRVPGAPTPAASTPSGAPGTPAPVAPLAPGSGTGASPQQPNK
jgi:tetratricopeptide (TPR) repeat protein